MDWPLAGQSIPSRKIESADMPVVPFRFMALIQLLYNF